MSEHIKFTEAVIQVNAPGDLPDDVLDAAADEVDLLIHAAGDALRNALHERYGEGWLVVVDI